MNSGHKHDHEHRDRHGHSHHHGHANDQGLSGILRYLRHAPRMWRSTVNDAVVTLMEPQSNESILDIGAGMGAGTVVAAQSGAKVLAVEPTPFLRTVLKIRRLRQKARKRITVADGAAEQLPANDDSIDAVWSVNTMHHWIEPAAATEEIVRVLRPGGRVILVDEDFQDPTHPDSKQFGSGENDLEHHGFTLVDANEMGDLFSAAGLKDVSASKKTVAGRPAIVVTGTA